MDEFTDKTTAINEMWQPDFTYFKIIGWGWNYLSTILDDYSRYIIAWKLCTNMRAEEVTDTIELALTASGCGQATVRHKPRLLNLSHGLQANHCRQRITGLVTSQVI
jgi:transposase InsO family protein